MSPAEFSVIDVHSHFVGAGWRLPQPEGHWQKIQRRIIDEDALLEEIASGDLIGRVVNTPTALFASAPDVEDYRRINDQLAALAARHPGRIIPLASIDAFAGEVAARELHRAVEHLGLRGAFVDSAKGGLLLDAPEARPLLRAASHLGVPVFVHPVNPQPLTTQMAPYGRLGTLLARGTVNSASLVALIAGGAFEELPDLRVVVTALAIGGILLTASFGDADQRGLLRRHVHVDTMGFDPALIRSAAAVLGADNVLAGSDWPIVSDGPIRERTEAALIAAGLSPADRAKVGRHNSLRLFSSR